MKNECDCFSKSRLDPLGNITTLYTCKVCMSQALELIRKESCNRESGMVQLEFTDVAMEPLLIEWGEGDPPSVGKSGLASSIYASAGEGD